MVGVVVSRDLVGDAPGLDAQNNASSQERHSRGGSHDSAGPQPRTSAVLGVRGQRAHRGLDLRLRRGDGLGTRPRVRGWTRTPVQLGLAVIDVPIYLGLVVSRQVLGLAQKLAETQDGLAELAVLLVAPPLVVDVVRVPGFDEHLRQQIHARLEAARQTFAARLALARVRLLRICRRERQHEPTDQGCGQQPVPAATQPSFRRLGEIASMHDPPLDKHIGVAVGACQPRTWSASARNSQFRSATSA